MNYDHRRDLAAKVRKLDLWRLKVLTNLVSGGPGQQCVGESRFVAGRLDWAVIWVDWHGSEEGRFLRGDSRG